MSDYAFPTEPRNMGYEGSDGTGASPGMTLRDYFAAAALMGLAANPESSQLASGKIAGWSYDLANAMLAARNDESRGATR